VRPANLLPDDLRRASGRTLPPEAIGAAVAGVALVAVMVGLYSMEHGAVTRREQTLAAVQAQTRAVPAPKKPAVAVSPELAADKDARTAAVDAALGQRISWDAVLRELSLVLPSDVWLTTLSAQGAAASPTDPSAPVAAGTSVTLTGSTYSQAAVARLLTRLALVPHFSNVTLQTAAGTTEGTRSVVGFTISAQIRNPGGSS
jgi:Tfp pilus assembly protein PilN